MNDRETSRIAPVCGEDQSLVRIVSHIVGSGPGWQRFDQLACLSVGYKQFGVITRYEQTKMRAIGREGAWGIALSA
jgi:hypothetical protein